jgi:hypothetical protein
MKFAIRRKESAAGVGTLGMIVIVVLVIVVLAYFGFAGLHL